MSDIRVIVAVLVLPGIGVVSEDVDVFVELLLELVDDGLLHLQLVVVVLLHLSGDFAAFLQFLPVLLVGLLFPQQLNLQNPDSLFRCCYFLLQLSYRPTLVHAD